MLDFSEKPAEGSADGAAPDQAAPAAPADLSLKSRVDEDEDAEVSEEEEEEDGVVLCTLFCISAPFMICMARVIT